MQPNPCAKIQPSTRRRVSSLQSPRGLGAVGEGRGAPGRILVEPAPDLPPPGAKVRLVWEAFDTPLSLLALCTDLSGRAIAQQHELELPVAAFLLRL